MKVMLVDDSKTMRSIQRGILIQMGHSEIEEATDGLDAMSKVEVFQPDLVLVDWNMPNMDGLTFVRNVRQKGLRFPIIMVTSEADKKRVIEAIRAGVNNYVVKPFTPDLLCQRIEETLAKAAEQAAQ